MKHRLFRPSKHSHPAAKPIGGCLSHSPSVIRSSFNGTPLLIFFWWSKKEYIFSSLEGTCLKLKVSVSAGTYADSRGSRTPRAKGGFEHDGNYISARPSGRYSVNFCTFSNRASSSRISFVQSQLRLPFRSAVNSFSSGHRFRTSRISSREREW